MNRDDHCFRNWPEGLIEVDADGTITQVNHKAAELLGWQEDELKGHGVHERLCSPALGYLHDASECPLIRDEFYRQAHANEYRWQSQSGEFLAIFARGVLLVSGDRRFIVFSDKSDTRYNQRDTERLASFAEHSPAPIIEFNCRGEIEFTNPAMTQLIDETGFDDEGNPRSLPADYHALIAKLCDGHPSFTQVETTCDDRYLVWDFYYIPSPDGGIIQGYGQDVTASRQLAESLIREKEAAEAANKAKSDFLSIMSHELRTPMNSIIGFSKRLLGRQDDLPPLYLSALNTIHENAQIMLEMINETLDMSRIEAGRMTPTLLEFKPADLAKEVYDLLVVQAQEKGIGFHLFVDESVPDLIVSDREFLRKILVNLCGNAIKFTEQGRVDLALRSPAEDILLVAVRDDGPGIDPRDQERIFEKFMQAENSLTCRHQGTGLGLALCKELARLLDGDIGVESEPGAGSLFWVQVPTNRHA